MMLGLSCGLRFEGDREGKKVLQEGGSMMEVSACMRKGVRNRAESVGLRNGLTR
jgi:hypothetical protein